MDKFSARHPILFQLLVFIAAFILVLVVSLGASVTCSAEAEAQNMHVAIGRLIAGGVLFLVFIRYFNIKKQLSGIVVMLPALLFAVWNIVLHFSMGGARAENYAYALILGLAPAVFEEVVFRGVFIHNLRANGRSPMSALLISAIFFGVVHMTNLLGSQHIINVIIQVSYSIVVGLVFGAIYIRTGDLVSVIIAHAIIDISSKILPSGQVIAFQWCIALIALLVVETFYAVHLMHSMATDSTSGISSSAGTGEHLRTGPAGPLVFQRFMGSVPKFYVPKFHIGNIPYFPDYGNAKYHEKEFTVTPTPPGGESCDRLV